MIENQPQPQWQAQHDEKYHNPHDSSLLETQRETFNQKLDLTLLVEQQARLIQKLYDQQIHTQTQLQNDIRLFARDEVRLAILQSLNDDGSACDARRASLPQSSNSKLRKRHRRRCRRSRMGKCRQPEENDNDFSFQEERDSRRCDDDSEDNDCHSRRLLGCNDVDDTVTTVLHCDDVENDDKAQDCRTSSILCTPPPLVRPQSQMKGALEEKKKKKKWQLP
mmetsp:Transcript_36655/g.44805  ORF Transcript_36655/g.44805 Transcript_36655/m.44805 type:complete len:222 (+) Transcript_36655:89-754(+)